VSITNADLASEPLDLTTVSAATLHVQLPNGEHREWSVTIETQDEDLLELEHVWAADGLDVEEPGPYRVYVDLTIPGGTGRAGPTSLTATTP
jgi:hypothetical protein